MKDKINEVLNQVRPVLQRDGGDVQLISYQDQIVTVQLVGACQGCAFSQMTLTNLIEHTLKKEIPEIKEVKAI